MNRKFKLNKLNNSKCLLRGEFFKFHWEINTLNVASLMCDIFIQIKQILQKKLAKEIIYYYIFNSNNLNHDLV